MESGFQITYRTAGRIRLSHLFLDRCMDAMLDPEKADFSAAAIHGAALSSDYFGGVRRGVKLDYMCCC